MTMYYEGSEYPLRELSTHPKGTEYPHKYRVG